MRTIKLQMKIVWELSEREKELVNQLGQDET